MSRQLQGSPWQIARSEWRANWRLGVAATLGAGLCFSVWSAVSSLFVLPLQEAFGWSRGEIALALNASLIAAFFSPLFGRIIDRVGVRPVLLVGLLGTAAAYLLLASMQGSLLQYYFFFTVLSIIGVTTTGLTFTRAVTGAFVGSRGLALAITRSGLALAGAFLPALVFFVMAKYGWRMGFVTLALLILVVVLPVVWLWMRGASLEPVTGSQVNKESAWHLLKNYKVLLICVAAAFNYAPIVALLSQFQPLLTGKGIAPAQAAWMIGLVGLAAVAGTLITGFLVDRIWAPLVACIFTLGPALGCFLLLPDSLSLTWAMIALVLLGLGQGAEIDVVAFMIARYFGMRSYAMIYGLSVLFIGVSVALGGTLIGLAFDAFGDYNTAIKVALGCFIVSALAYLAMGRYPAQESSH